MPALPWCACAPLAEHVSEQPKPPSRRQAARLAAVQALYQWQEGQDEPAAIIDQFLNVRTGERARAACAATPTSRCSRTWSRAPRATRTSSSRRCPRALAEDWTWGRIDRLVRAILLAGAYELVHRRDVPPKVAINEYVEIAHAFYDQGEPNFVNSVLDRVARQERAAELAG
jgi:N utilization substance protein B